MPKPLLVIRSRVRIETKQNLLVAQRVLLLHNTALGDGAALDGTQHSLHLGAVDELIDVCLRNHVRREQEVALQLAGLGGAAVDAVESLKGRRGPDDEAAEMASWRELKQVESVDGAGLDACDVAEGTTGLSAVFFRIEDDERTATLRVATTAQLALAGPQLLGRTHFLHIRARTDSVEEAYGSGSLADGAAAEGSAGDDEGYLWDAGDVVAAGEEERSG